MKRLAIGCGVTLALVLMCCGGTAAYFLDGLGTPSPSPSGATLAACGQGTTVTASGKIGTLAGTTATQMRYATIVIATGQKLDVPPRGWVIAIATALQESNLQNLGNLGKANDHDSLGLFQQRPSQGWGTPAQVMDPVYASTQFYDRLVKIPGWATMALTVAAQRVQHSAFPDAYARHEDMAAQIVNKLAAGASRAVGSSAALRCTGPGEIAASGWTAPVIAPIVSGWRTPSRPTHNGVDLGAPRGTPIHAAASGIVIRVRCNVSFGSCDQDGSPAIQGCGWYLDLLHAGGIVTRYCHQLRQPIVHVGQTVTAGQVIGISGTSGNSSGPHVHVEVHVGGGEDFASAIDPVPFMSSKGAPLGMPGR